MSNEAAALQSSPKSDSSSFNSFHSTRSSTSVIEDLNIESVSIPDYQTQHNSENNKFTTYSIVIVTTYGEWTVYRRYSQFLKLHNSLPEHIRNELPMPPKKFQGHLNDTFVRKRKNELEKYIQRLVSLSNLSGTDVGSFLGCDLNAKPQTTAGIERQGLRNKNMTEFNWVHRTGGMGSNMIGSPNYKGKKNNNSSKKSNLGRGSNGDQSSDRTTDKRSADRNEKNLNSCALL
jgi:hypothetical protein